MYENLKTYGLKIDIEALKKASKETRDSAEGISQTVMYDSDNGYIWVDEHVGNSYTQYSRPEYIYAKKTRVHLTKQEIIDAIAYTICSMKHDRNDCKFVEHITLTDYEEPSDAWWKMY